MMQRARRREKCLSRNSVLKDLAKKTISCLPCLAKLKAFQRQKLCAGWGVGAGGGGWSGLGRWHSEGGLRVGGWGGGERL